MIKQLQHKQKKRRVYAYVLNIFQFQFTSIQFNLIAYFLNSLLEIIRYEDLLLLDLQLVR